MSAGRTKNAVRNIAWGVVNKGVNLLLPFMSRTVIIRILGAEYLGLNSLFIAVLSVLSLAELGVSNAIVCSLYKPIAEKDTDTVCALMSLYKSAYRVIGIVIMVLGLLMAPFLKFFIKGDVPNDIDIYILYFVYLFNTVASYFLFAYKNCLLVAHQRNDVTLKITTVCSTAQNVVQMLLLIIVKNYYIYAILVPVFTIASNLVTAYFSGRYYPEYVCRGKISGNTLETLKKQITGLLVGKIAGTIRASIDSIFVSAFMGLVTVAMYNNYFHIVSAVSGIIQILDTSIVATVGNSIVTEPVEKNYSDYKKFYFMLQWIVGWCSICILCLIQPFMELWVGQELMFKNLMATLCAAYCFVQNISLVRSIYTQAVGMWWQLRYLSVVDIFINLGLNLVLGYNFGAYGIILASILDVLFVSIPWTTYYLFRDYFGCEKMRDFMKQLISYFLVALFLGSVTYGICSRVVLSNIWFDLIVRGVICIVIPNVGYIFVFSKNRILQEAIEFIKYALGGRGK